MILPANTKKGIASSVKPSRPTVIFCEITEIAASGGRAIRIENKDDSPIANVIGTPTASIMAKLPNKTIIG
ncbi:Uncharacterised protein [Salmonella enterica subsp. enterica serovar Bovismorbificans]|uniref:Uncharacterized protein n=1 Tax=Salmonella enterica subsp. enterica serovar Bovismorbificans TaxID=58097 RepID=A0A655CPU9_SALET|nr:Uncharacterised protein [Salmonella enterica subsp. enterica serovar Bovismorbificans]